MKHLRYFILERLMFACVDIKCCFEELGEKICDKIPDEFLDRRRKKGCGCCK